MAVHFRHIPEGFQHNYNFDEIHFIYNEKEIELYSNKNGEDVTFEDFMEFDGVNKPKSGQGFLSPQLVENLKKIDIIATRPVQIASIMVNFFRPPVRAPRQPDFALASSTGSGKTIAYLVPMIQKCLKRAKDETCSDSRTPLVLIFTKSLHLVLNVYQKAVELTSGMDIKIALIAGNQKAVPSTNFDIGVCTVGKFRAHLNEDSNLVKLDLSKVKYFVVDEADDLLVMDEMDYIYKELKKNKNLCTMLFSATSTHAYDSYYDVENFYEFASGSVNNVAASVQQLFWPVSTRVHSRIYGAFENTITFLKYEEHEKRNPFDALYYFLKDHLMNTNAKCIVFLKRGVITDILAQRLRKYGFNAISINGRQRYRHRMKYLDQFINGDVRIAVTTGILARGSDLDVDYVVNFDLPLDFIDYVHRCGRTGRNGRRGFAITLVDTNNPQDYSSRCLQSIAGNLPAPCVPYFMKSHAEKEMRKKELEDEARELFMEMEGLCGFFEDSDA